MTEKHPLAGKQLFPFIAPPNGGKGTQTAALLRTFPGKLSKVDMGGLLRAAAADENNPLGQKIREAQLKGQLVEIGIVIDVLEEGLKKAAMENPNVVGFILDGFPRNMEQYEKLHEMADKVGAKITRAVYLNVPEQAIIDRAAGRIFHKTTHEPYNIRIPAMAPPDFDPKTFSLENSAYYQRDDDKEETVRKRLNSFQGETQPMIDAFRREGTLVELNGDRPPEAITQELLEEIKPFFADVSAARS